MDADEVARVEGILFKDTPEWKTAYAAVKQLLAGREHVLTAAENSAARLDRTRTNRTAEHHRRR